MNSTLRSKLFGAAVKKEPLLIPELDATVEIRGMTAGAKGRVLTYSRIEGSTNAIDFERYTTRLVIESVYDPESGEQLFGPADSELIGSMPADVVEQMTDVANRLSGTASAAVVLEKNSAPTPTDDTSST